METFLLMQRAFKRERVFRDRNQPLDFLNDIDLISRYRFPRRVLKELINVVDVTCRPAKTSRFPCPKTPERKMCKLLWVKIIRLKNCSVPTQEPNNAKERNNAITFKYIISVPSLNILFLFLLVIIYPIVLNLNTCININNEYNTRVVWKNTY